MEYFLHKDGQNLGPYDEATLKTMLAQGQILSSDLIWNDQMPNWETMESVLPQTPKPAAPIPVAAAPVAAAPVAAAPVAAAPVAAASAPTREEGKSQAIDAKPHQANLLKKAGIAFASIAIVAGIVWFFVGQPEPQEPRSRDEILREKVALPSLFLTGVTLNRVISTNSAGVFIDQASGELCWPALECQNPICPGRGENGKFFMFIFPDPSFYLKPDKTIGFDMAKAKAAGTTNRGQSCPKCLTKRTLSLETQETREQYANYVRPYVLPETAKRLAELEAEENNLAEVK
jgi:hypothetical protein